MTSELGTKDRGSRRSRAAMIEQVIPARSSARSGEEPQMMWDSGWSAWYWIPFGLMMLIFWGLVAAGVVWLLRTPRDSRGPAGSDQNADRPGTDFNTARRILDERYAKGELSDEEYRNRRDLLDLR